MSGPSANAGRVELETVGTTTPASNLRDTTEGIYGDLDDGTDGQSYVCRTIRFTKISFVLTLFLLLGLKDTATPCRTTFLEGHSDEARNRTGSKEIGRHSLTYPPG